MSFFNPPEIVDVDIQQTAINTGRTLLRLIQNVSNKGTAKTVLFVYLHGIPKHVLDILLISKSNLKVVTDTALLDLCKEFLPAACDQDDVDILLALLNAGADPYLRGTKGTPLEVASLKGSKELLEKLYTFEQDLFHDIEQLQACLTISCRHGHKHLVQYWMERMRDVVGTALSDFNFDPQYDLLKASRSGGHNEISKELMQLLWADDEAKGNDDESEQQQSMRKRKVAKWSKRNIPYFDSKWLYYDRSDEYLVEIDLSRNSIFNIDGDIMWNLPHLEVLDLSYCHLRQIPEIKKMNQFKELRLQKLNLSHNRLKQIPSDLFMVVSLIELQLQYNSIDKINDVSASFLQNVNTATQDPGETTWECKSLTHLDLSSNTELQKIPPGIQGARQLKKLNLESCCLQQLPESWTCPLETLNASNNALSTVNNMYKWRRTLKNVSLSRNKLNEFPTTVCQLFAAQHLDLSHNNIQRLPAPTEWQTYRLSILNLSNNNILSLNRDLKQSLINEQNEAGKRRVWRQVTGLKQFPDWLLDLPLETDADECVFPSMLSTRLKELNLNSNWIQEFPVSVCQLKMLQMLHISGNPFLTRLPEQLGQLRGLFTLDVDKRKITEPAEILQDLRNEDGVNATKIIRILKEKLLNYQPYKGVKIMITGPRDCGKTTLFKHLTMGTSESADGYAVNNIVNVHTWTRYSTWVPYTQEAKFTVWDVQGGEENAVISQTLFTSNTVYLLVWNANNVKKHLPEIRNWMLNVKMLAPGCRIIGIGTQLLQTSSDVSSYLSYHLTGDKTLKDLLAHEIIIDIATPYVNALKDLSHLILEYAKKMKARDLDSPQVRVPLIGRKVPEAFLLMQEELRQELLRQQHQVTALPRIITEEKFRQLLRECMGSNSDVTVQLDKVIRFLREAGSLINVSDHTVRLNSLYFLDPNWLCSVLLSPIDTKAKHDFNRQRSHSRRVPKKNLKVCCKESGFGEGRFEEYLELLARFEIAIPATPDSYFLPDLLIEGRPYVEEAEEESFLETTLDVIRLYKTNMLPPGFSRRLISRILADTRIEKHDNRPTAENTLAWKSGIVINNQSNDHQRMEVELLEQEENGVSSIYICLSVQSTSRRFLAQGIGFLVDHVEYLFKDWYADFETPNAEDAVQRLVPCPKCAKEHRQSLTDIISKGHHFKFKDLTVAAIVERKDTIECHSHRTDENNRNHIALKDIVPDLFLLDLQIAVLKESDIKVSSTKLGEGGFGVVFKADIAGQPVALKSLLKHGFNEQITTEELIDSVILQFPDFRREISTMSRLQHACILQLTSVSIQKLWFAMEFAPYGDLASYIDDQPRIPDIDDESTPYGFPNYINGTALDRMLTFKIVYQIVAAVEYLHGRGIIHTDLKTNNILVFSPDVEDCVNVKIADYGISQYASTGGAVRGHAGQHIFVAPEIINGKVFDRKADIFSVGMIIYHVVSGQTPGGHDNAIDSTMDVTKDTRPVFEFQDYTVLPNFKHLEVIMESCWKEDPDLRLSAATISRSMKKPGFYALCEHLEIKKQVDGGCVALMTDGAASCLYLWVAENNGKTQQLCAKKIYLDTMTTTKVHGFDDQNVVCAFNYKELLVIATDSEGIHVLERQPEGCHEQHELQESKRLKLAVASMLYVPDIEQESSGFLYCGLQDGRLVIYEHRERAWKFFKTFLVQPFGVPSPCSCIIHLKSTFRNSSKVLIGCGSSIKSVKAATIGDLKTQSEREVEVFAEIPQEVPIRQQIQDLVSSLGNVWCFLNESFKIHQFNEATGAHLATYEIGATRLSRGDYISSSEIRTSRPTTLAIDAHNSDGTHNTDNTLQAAGECDSEKTTSVTSLKVVKNALWVGRSAGDILVVNIDNSANFAKIEAVLEVDPLFHYRVGPVRYILNPTPGKIVTVRDEIDVNGDSRYHILTWEDWGSKEAEKFENALRFQ